MDSIRNPYATKFSSRGKLGKGAVMRFKRNGHFAKNEVHESERTFQGSLNNPITYYPSESSLSDIGYQYRSFEIVCKLKVEVANCATIV